MEFIFLLTLTLLYVAPSRSEGSNSSWTPPPSTDSDTQGSSGTTLVDRGRGGSLGYSKGQVYNNAQSYPYSSGGNGFYRNYNYNYITPRPAASYYSNQRGDKSYYGGSAASGRTAGDYVPYGGYTYTSRFSKGYQDPIQSRQSAFSLPQHLRTNYQDPIQSRQSAFSLPQHLRTNYVYGGSFQKGSSGYSYPANTNTGQVNRGSRILFEEPNRAQFTIPTRTKSTGVYVIPTPAKLYFDGIQN